VEFANIIVKPLRKNAGYFVMVYTVNKTKDVYTILADLAVRAEKDLEIFIPSGSLLLQDKLNLEFLAKNLEKLGKVAKFDTDDANCKELLDRLNLVADDFGGTQNVSVSGEKFHRAFLIKLKFFVLSAMSRLENLAKLKKPGMLPKINFALLSAFIVVLAGLIYGGYHYASSQKAYIKIYTKSEPLARSITIRVDSNSSTNTDEKILEGTDISTSVFETKEIETTGEKEKGDYAEGEIVIYNYTKEEIKLDKGVKVFCEDDDDLGFKLADGVTMGPATYEVQEDPLLSMKVIPKEVRAPVEALEYGDDYNIEGGKTLEFKDYEKEDLLAKSSKDFKGGNTEIVKIVSEEDIAKLKEVIETALMGQSAQAINDVVPSDYKLIKGSITTLLGDPELSAEVGDEETKVNIKQALTVFGLAYSEKKMDQLIMKVVGDYVPEEYALAGTKHTLNVEVLGATEDTVLSNSAADLQVTVKTYVIPEIDIDSLKESLKGLSVKEVQRELGGMSNITTYEFSLSPIVPLKKKVPNDVEKIFIEIQEGSDD